MSDIVVQAKAKRKQQRLKEKKQKAKQQTGKKHKLPSSSTFLRDQDNFQEEEFDDLYGALDENENFVEFDDNINEELQVFLDVREPDISKDYFGVELYLKNYLHGNPFDYVQFTEMVLGNEKTNTPNPLTSIIKIPSDEYPDDDNKNQKGKPSIPKTATTTTTSSSSSSSPLTAAAEIDMEVEENNDDNNDDNNDEMVDVTTWEWNDIYGVVSILDFHSHKTKQCMKEIKNYILGKCLDMKLKQELKEILENGKVGLLVNERVINMPTELAPELHENLFEELEEEMKQEKCTFFKYFLIMTKIYFESGAKNLGNNFEAGEKKSKKKKQQLLPQQEEISEQKYLQNKNQGRIAYFTKPEEELYYVRSKLVFSFELPNNYTYDSKTTSLDSQISNEVLVMIIEREKIPKILKRIRKSFSPEKNEGNAQE